VVEPEAQRGRSAPEADHRAPVVGDREANRETELPGEIAGQRLRLVRRHLPRRKAGTGVGVEEEQLSR